MAAEGAGVAPLVTKDLLENERVKVYETHLKPGEKTESHPHPEYVVYVLSDFRLKITYMDGRSEESEVEKGQAFFSPEEEAHVAENTGEGDALMLVIELKR